MRHSYATWMLEAGADLRWVRDQLGHASIEETEGTYGHLERERHEGRVDLDAVLGGVQLRPPASTVLDAGGQLRDFPLENLVVEGKGFEAPDPPSGRNLATPSLPQTAPSGIPCPPASAAPHPIPLPDVPPSAPPPHADEPCEQKRREGRDLLITSPDSEQTQQDRENPEQSGDVSA